MDACTEELTREELIALLVGYQSLQRTSESHSGELETENASLRAELEKVNTKFTELQSQLAWFQKQLFGTKSERRIIGAASSNQITIGEHILGAQFHKPDVATTETVKSYARKKATKEEPKEGSFETLLRFDPSVPMEEVVLPLPAIAKLNPDQYEVIDHEQSYKLAQTPSSYVVIKYLRPVVKVKESGTLHTAPLPPMVIERSLSDVSFHAGSLVDKFVYHIPFNRQHQRLAACGITISRATLPTQAIRVIELIDPVYDAQEGSVYDSKVLTMDDTWMKVGVEKKGKMHKGYFWPMYGDKDEIIFPYTQARTDAAVRELLGDRFHGVLLADGHEAYDKYAAKRDSVIRAQCWVHTRRNFFELSGPPDLREGALDRITRMYELEERIRKKGLTGQEKLRYRGEHIKPVVEEFFEWLKAMCLMRILLPSDPFLKAATYALKREAELKVFLSNPDVPMDTNHNERALRVIPMGRRNYLFCWTELGAKTVGKIQSLLVTCKLQGIDPYVYLVDVLQRIQTHPMRDVALLTPRLWKQHFAANPLVSPLEMARRQKNESLLQKIASQEAA